MKFNNRSLKLAVDEWNEDPNIAANKFGHISNWNVSNVTNMSYLFDGHSKFNEDISGWKTEKVKNFSGMFNNAELFNQNINCWDTSNATKMKNMFKGATSFNQPLADWDVSQVITMEGLFEDAKAFNQPISDWDVSKVTNMKALFNGATSFNQSIENWNVSNVSNMWVMFAYAISFNKPLNKWDVRKVKTMQGMFAEAESFNQSINNWDVGNVRSMQAMFNRAKSFNQDISSWDTSKVVYNIGDGIKSFNNINTPEINIENNSIYEVNWLEINQPIYIDSGDDNLQMNTLYYDELNQEVFSVVSSNKAAKEIIDSIFDTIGGDFIKLNKNELDKLSSPIKSCIEAYQGNNIRLEIAKTLLSIQLIISKCDNKEVLKTYNENSFLNSDAQFSESIKFNNTTLREAIDLAKKSKLLPKIFHADVLEHYIHAAHWEQSEYDKSVNDWEHKRYFERG